MRSYANDATYWRNVGVAARNKETGFAGIRFQRRDKQCCLSESVEVVVAPSSKISLPRHTSL
jgi:hypothetical protein